MSLENGHVSSIRRYLLGDVSEQERENIEDRLMADDDLYQELLLAEDDLIDDYIFGNLSEEDRPKFNKRFLEVPELRQHVGFTAALRKHALKTKPQALVDAAAMPQVVITEEARPPRPSIFDYLRSLFNRPVIGLGFAAVLLGAIALNAWLIRQNSQLRGRVAQLEGQQTDLRVATLQRELESAQQRNQELSDRVAVLEQRSPNPPTEDPRKERTPEPSGTTNFAVTLLSGLTRASGEETKKLQLPPGTQTVTFNLDVAPGDYSSYRAVLETGEGEQKARSGQLSFARGNVVPFTIAAKVVIPGDYCIVLSGVKSSNAAIEVGRYCFRVLQ